MPEQFNTASLYLAGFLKCRGVTLLSIDRDDRGRSLFVFRDSAKRQTLCDAFFFGKSDNVGAKEYMQALRELKSLLYDR